MQDARQPRAAIRQQWLMQIDATLRGQGIEPAARLALQALGDGIEHPSILNLAAAARYGEGRLDEAAQLLRRARALAPKDAQILNSLGICLQGLGRTDAALEAYGAAIRAEPGLAAAHFNRGTLLESISDLPAARAAYEKAAAADRNYLEPVAGMAWLEAQAGDHSAARAHANQVLARSPPNVLARMAMASAELHAGDRSTAAEILARLSEDESLSPVNRSIVLGLMGDVHDAAGRPAEAFAAYEGSSAQLRAWHASQFAGPGKHNYLEHVRRVAAWIEADERKPWRESPPHRPRAADPTTHVFLVGFPRSGTTLLENVLAAHPNVATLEEKYCLESVAADYLASPEGLARLARISSGEAARQREAYWTKVRSHGIEPRGRVFIDKMPLASVQLPVIAKLFPQARILFARRDPRDVVLSCFRRRFGMNTAMYQLLTIEGAAALYDEVMRLSAVYRGLLPLPQHIVRYEDLVEDFEATVRATCAFLGLEWDPAMSDFAARAHDRGISTPSAAQVARGLNRDGQGVWRRYEAQMAPVLPMLEPWVREFGYPSA